MGNTRSGAAARHGDKAPISDATKTALAWHKEHCSDADLCLAQNIQQAYPFDHNAKKQVSKKERLYGADRRSNWGSVTVTRTGIRRLLCCACGTFIADRLSDTQFYYCRRCKGSKRRLDICLKCFERGALSASSRNGHQVQPFARGADMLSPASSGHMSIKSEPGRTPPGRSSFSMQDTLSPPAHRHRSLPVNPTITKLPGAVSPRPLTLPPTVIPKDSPSRGGANRSIPSGMWRGFITEDGHCREAIRKLQFNADRSIAGSGEHGCDLKGSYTACANNYKVSWSEAHGKRVVLEVAGMLLWDDQKTANITGKFTALDGGSGFVDLMGPK